MGLTAPYDLEALRLRAYSMLVDWASNQAQELINENLSMLPPPHRLLDLIRLRERQLQVTGDNLEGAMRLLKEAKEATSNLAGIKLYV